jgi:uncharacterized protein (DUF342 family)
VSRELVIRGDVDFETGHVDFQGNVRVAGVVKAGFRVACVDLTAGEIHGGRIEITGDLNVSGGIVDAEVSTMGGVQARFVNHSRITAFDDVTVMREIMGSEILSGGAVVNTAGQITASLVAAKKGMTLARVGTDRSEPCTLRAGVGDHVNSLLASLDRRIESLENQRENLLEEKKALEERNFAMHREVSELSFAQERQTRSLEELKQQCLTLKGKKEAMIANLKEMKRIELALADSDTVIKGIFQDQDRIMKAVDGFEEKVREAESQAGELRLEKEAIREISSLEKGLAEIRVEKRMVAGTRLAGPGSSLILKESLGACRILEIASTDPDDPHGRRLVVQPV